jgi:hypothetical protein
MVLRADNLDAVEVRVAEPGPLVAMKLQNLPNRPSAKEATDLLDISKLLLDQSTAAHVRSQLAAAAQQIREDVLLHADLWLRQNASASARRMRLIPEGGKQPLTTSSFSDNYLLRRCDSTSAANRRFRSLLSSLPQSPALGLLDRN